MMHAYYVIFFMFWFNYLLSIVIKREQRLPFELLAMLLFVLFAGLRFQTGNDWLIYQQAYEAMPDILEFEYLKSSTFEPLYVLFTYVAHEFFGFQILMLLIVIFNGLVLFWFCKFFRVGVAGVCAIYFAWAYLSVQMAAVRYSMAVSFVLLATVFWARGMRYSSVLAIIIGTGFHTFSIIFLPFMFLIQKKIKLGYVFFLLVGSMVVALTLSKLLLFGLFSWLPFEDKILFYINNSAYDRISIGAAFYLLLNILLLINLLYFQSRSALANLAAWATLLLVVFQLSFWFLPVFWTRLQAYVLIIQACYLVSIIDCRRLYLLALGLMTMSLAVLTKTLVDPAFISYLPYQNVVLAEVFGLNDHSGVSRFYESLYIHEDRNVR